MKILPFRSGQRFRSINALLAPIIVAVLILVLKIAAASDHSAKNFTTKSIRISADKLITEIDAAEIDFIGNVKALQAGAVITADRLKIIYDPDAIRQKDGSRKTEPIRKIIASGRVIIRYDNIVAEADTAEYTIKSAVLVLIGKPSRVNRQGYLLTGSKITLQRANGTMKVESSGEDRVRAIFNPD